MRRRVVVLGSTGSIGTQALDIIRANPDRFEVVGLSSGGGQPELLAAQAVEFNVPRVAVAAGADAVVRHAPQVQVDEGQSAVVDMAGCGADVVLNGITGAVGLMPTIAALSAGSTLALANKESLVIGGRAVTRLAAPGQIVPVDSEHSALAQAMRSGAAGEVGRLILTASGGPFRGRSRDQLAAVTAADALAHPTWEMGPVVTVNSSTLMNKGLEVIEAHLLFDVPMERIDVVVHPQSIVHSMVEFVDGSVIAQASPPDMRLPIALGLAWPDRVPGSVRACDWSAAASWTFEPVDHDTFPALRLAQDAGAAGGCAPAVLNAANEVAVEAFLAGRLAYLAIVDTVAAVLAEYRRGASVSDDGLTVEDVVAADAWSREQAARMVG